MLTWTVTWSDEAHATLEAVRKADRVLHERVLADFRRLPETYGSGAVTDEFGDTFGLLLGGLPCEVFVEATSHVIAVVKLVWAG